MPDTLGLMKTLIRESFVRRRFPCKPEPMVMDGAEQVTAYADSGRRAAPANSWSVARNYPYCSNGFRAAHRDFRAPSALTFLHSFSYSLRKTGVDGVGNLYTILWIDGWEGRWAMSKLLFASTKIWLTVLEIYEVHRAVIQLNACDSVDRIPDAAVGLAPFDPEAYALGHGKLATC